MKRAVVIKGDGIGPEIADAALKVLSEVEAMKRVELMVAEGGSEWWSEHGGDSYIPRETWELLESSDACLKAPLRTLYAPGAPRSAVVAMRRRFNLYANIRPIRSFRARPGPLGPVDHVYVRENTEDLYAGIEYRISQGSAISIRKTTYEASYKLMRRAFELAKRRSWGRVLVVHKATVIRETDGLFLEAARAAHSEFPDVGMDEMLVDNVAQQLVLNPRQFDGTVIAGPNLYLDILSEESAALVGGIGVVYSMNMGDAFALFEPAHGSAPDLRGKGVANPIAMIQAAAAMMDYLGEPEIAAAIFDAVEAVVGEGRVLTPDMGGRSSTAEVALEIAKRSREALRRPPSP